MNREILYRSWYKSLNRFFYFKNGYYHPNDDQRTPNAQLVLNEIADVEKRLGELKSTIETIRCCGKEEFPDDYEFDK